MATHVTSVTLSLDTDEHGQVWRLDWTEVRDGRDAGTWTKTHHTEGAARRHATGLVATPQLGHGRPFSYARKLAEVYVSHDGQVSL